MQMNKIYRLSNRSINEVKRSIAHRNEIVKNDQLKLNFEILEL